MYDKHLCNKSLLEAANQDILRNCIEYNQKFSKIELLLSSKSGTKSKWLCTTIKDFLL